jgi:hypothetical protein
VLLNKLESGFLLLQTQQGSFTVQPSSFWQRVYLLWTFRNFRQLSPLLLNARQTALINDLFLENAAVISLEYEPGLEIGIVEDFVPPGIEMGARPEAKTDASPAMEATLPELTAGQWVEPPFIRGMMADLAPAVTKATAPIEGAGIDGAEIARRHFPDGSFQPINFRFESRLGSWLRLAWSNLATSKRAAIRLQAPRIAVLMFATAIGALGLCAGFVVAFRGTGASPGSQARSSSPQLHPPDSPSAPGPASAAEDPSTAPEAAPQVNSPDSPSAPAPTSAPEDSTAAPEANPQDATRLADAVPDAAVEPAPVQEAPAITTPHRTTAPERASRPVSARVASRSSGGFHAAAFSRAPASTSARRITLAPASRGDAAPSARHYFDLADQQMHKGNYAAAEANYKRAWRIEENRAAAKGRLARARRTMQAEKENIAPPQ